MRCATQATAITLIIAAATSLPAPTTSAQHAYQAFEQAAQLHRPPIQPFTPTNTSPADIETYAKHCIYSPDGSVWTFGPLLEELDLFKRVNESPNRNRTQPPPWFIDINSGQTATSIDQIIETAAKRIGLTHITGTVVTQRNSLNISLDTATDGYAPIATFDVKLSSKDTLYSANISDWESRTRQSTYAFLPNRRMPNGIMAGNHYVAVEIKLRPATTQDLVETIHKHELKTLPVRIPRTYPAPRGERGVNIRWHARRTIIRDLPEIETPPEPTEPEPDPLTPFRFPQPGTSP